MQNTQKRERKIDKQVPFFFFFPPHNKKCRWYPETLAVRGVIFCSFFPYMKREVCKKKAEIRSLFFVVCFLQELFDEEKKLGQM